MSHRLWYTTPEKLYVAEVTFLEDPLLTERHDFEDWILEKETAPVVSNLSMRNGMLLFSTAQTVEEEITNELKSFGACSTG